MAPGNALPTSPALIISWQGCDLILVFYALRLLWLTLPNLKQEI